MSSKPDTATWAIAIAGLVVVALFALVFAFFVVLPIGALVVGGITGPAMCGVVL